MLLNPSEPPSADEEPAQATGAGGAGDAGGGSGTTLAPIVPPPQSGVAQRATCYCFRGEGSIRHGE